MNLHSCVVALPQGDEEVYHPWRALTDASPAHLKEPSEVAQHLYQMFPPSGGVLVMGTDHGEGPGHAGVICHSARLGMPWDSAERAGRIDQGTGSLSVPAQTAVP